VGPVTSVGAEVPPRQAGSSPDAVERLWHDVEALYRTGVHPAIQVCVRREGHVVLNRAIGHASGNAPEDPEDGPRVALTPETPVTIYSASKAITAMVIHKLDELGRLHLEDRVCDFIPEFAKHGKDRITIRHLLAHRAGIPNVPPESMDLDLLGTPDRGVEILCDARPRTRPGRLLAYHAVSGGFVLGEVVRRITGADIRAVLRREILEPLGFRWTNYGVAAADVGRVAVNAVTGPPAPPPLKQVLSRALGVGLREVVELSNDERFLRGIVPSANVVTTAEELSAFFQCLLDEGTLDGVRVFEPSTIRHATSEQSYLELDLTLGVPLRYGLGFMLGDDGPNLFGWNNANAFGHVGFTNTFAWADPERRLSVALLTTGKPIVSVHVVRLFQLLFDVNRIFPKLESGRRGGRPRQAPVSATRRSRRSR
jgi:CubicO group peptidase (beta-lactamase class C family)